jgi:hypothetical protein
LDQNPLGCSHQIGPLALSTLAGFVDIQAFCFHLALTLDKPHLHLDGKDRELNYLSHFKNRRAIGATGL